MRDRQNWIGGNSFNPRGAEFVPPPPDHVEASLADLAEFLNRDDLPANLQAAIAHAQFQTIHPFADGNGRVGRCLIHVAFRRADLSPRYVPPISLVLAGEVDEYLRGLTAYRNGDLEDWALYFATKTREATVKARELAVDVAELRERWAELPGEPIVTIKSAARLIDASEDTARRAVTQLENAGVLRQVTVGRRNRAWEAREVFELLDVFEGDLAAAQT